MKNILEKSIKLADLVSKISAAAEEQSNKVVEVDGMFESTNRASSEQANTITVMVKR